HPFLVNAALQGVHAPDGGELRAVAIGSGETGSWVVVPGPCGANGGGPFVGWGSNTAHPLGAGGGRRTAPILRPVLALAPGRRGPDGLCPASRALGQRASRGPRGARKGADRLSRSRGSVWAQPSWARTRFLDDPAVFHRPRRDRRDHDHRDHEGPEWQRFG